MLTHIITTKAHPGRRVVWERPRGNTHPFFFLSEERNCIFRSAKAESLLIPHSEGSPDALPRSLYECVYGLIKTAREDAPTDAEFLLHLTVKEDSPAGFGAAILRLDPGESEQELVTHVSDESKIRDALPDKIDDYAFHIMTAFVG